jgi:hypothetical protein
MLKKFISLSLALACIVIFTACGSKTSVVTGTIKDVQGYRAGNKLEFALNLEGRPETYLIQLSDAYKLGITKIKNSSSPPELMRLMQDINSIKGWKVKLTCEKTNKQQGPEYLVKTLEKLPGN